MKRPRKPKPGECHLCVEEGIAPAPAIACHLHSTLLIRELRAEIAVLKDTASASSKLHLAIAELNSAVPSADGSEELQSVVEARDRIERIAQLAEHLSLVAGWDDAAALELESKLFATKRKRGKS